MSTLDRDDVVRALRPIAPFFRSAILKAREFCDIDQISAATPHISRVAHLRRISGTERWMVIADDLVSRDDEMPAGYCVVSTELDHNRGRYAFQFPMGIFTIRREPHEGEEGAYIQERLEGIAEQAPLAEGVDAFAGATAYLSVPPSGAVKIIVTHPTLEEPMIVLLDELETIDSAAVPALRPMPQPRTTVQSSRKREEVAEDATDES